MRNRIKSIVRALVPRPLRLLVGHAQAHPGSVFVGFAIRHPRVACALIFDGLSTKSSMKFIEQALPQKPTGEAFVIVGSGLLINWIKILAYLGAGLRLRGWTGYAILEQRSDWISAFFFRCMGIRNIRNLDTYELTENERSEIDDFVSSHMARKLSLADVKKWKFRNADVGVFALSTLARKAYQGAPDLEDPEVREKIPPILRRALKLIIASRRVCEETQPKVCIDLSSFYLPSGPIIDSVLQLGGRAIRVHQPWNDDALLCKSVSLSSMREHPSSLAPANFSRIFEECWGPAADAELENEFDLRYSGHWEMQRRNQPSNRQMSRSELCEEYNLDPEKPIAVVFSHVLWDANTFYGEDLFDDYGEWFKETAKAAATNDHVNWIIKMHPVDAFKRAREGASRIFPEVAIIEEAVGSQPKNFVLLEPMADVSTLSIFKAADYAVTVRGTSGMEAPCFGAATLVAGTGRYSGLGFTVDPSTREEYLEKIRNIQDIPSMTNEQLARARCHAFAVFRLRPWRMKSVRFSLDVEESGWQYLDQNMELLVSTKEALDDLGDIDAWAEWVAKLDESDYLDADLVEEKRLARHEALASGEARV